MKIRIPPTEVLLTASGAEKPFLSRGCGRLVPAEQQCRERAFGRHVADVRR